MDLKIKLEQLHQKVVGLKDQIGTEEATKNAFVMPLYRFWVMIFLILPKSFPNLFATSEPKKAKK